ncbi:MAG: hypothetical protein ACRYFW_02095 [Janthinobacterium lividum]
MSGRAPSGLGVSPSALSRRQMLGAAVAGPLTALAAQAQAAPPAGRVFTPELYGAKGDGVTNDTAAFRLMSEAMTAAHGGVISLRAVTYIVGTQRHDPASPDSYAYAPSPIIDLKGCSAPVRIEGNGARLRCAPGLRFGVFDPVSGARVDRKMPNMLAQGRASPYHCMIWIERCAAGVTIEHLELDGASAAAVIGGQWGDTGWQIPATGMYLLDNGGPLLVRGVHTHHHLQDGMMISATPARAGETRRFERVRADHNARNGCSVIGGDGWTFEDCRFTDSGRSVIWSMPGVGVDLEAERGPIRDVAFSRCTFANNVCPGMVADSGDTARARFADCTFVGTTAWAAWPDKPFFSFERCVFVGAICRAHTSDDPHAATHFRHCIFTDDPRRSPTGKVYSAGPIADLSDGKNVRFDGCSFLVAHGSALPWSAHAIYADCTMRQVNGKQGYPRGTYLGNGSIVGDVDLAQSTIAGTLKVNGVRRAETR